jgi:uncharacterized protein
MKRISATDLYSYIKCPHRVTRDTFDDPKLKDPPNEFVQLLWEKGVAHEREVIARQKGEIAILDLSGIPPEERFIKTKEAMHSKVPYVYQGYLEVDDLVGKPDLLELQSTGEYIPIDIKAGMGYEGEEDEDEGRLKKHYAVQIGLYVDALIRLGFLKRNFGRILDSRAVIVDYDLSMVRGAKTPQTWWEFYLDVLGQVRKVYAKNFETEPALGSVCKLCEWYTDCKKQCEKSRCVTLIPELGRSRKDALGGAVKNIQDLARLDMSQFQAMKTRHGINGIGEKLFEKMNRRAKLLTSGRKEPVILGRFSLPQKPIEIFFDIESDPTQDIVYLHGLVERRQGGGAPVIYSFVARDVSLEEEKRAWAEFWAYLRSLPADEWAMYYYSKYERTQYRILAERFSDVATAAEVEWLFDPARSIDLYFDIVYRHTDWPTYNYSIKTLATHLGFKWRDENPSGAASIQWFNEWCQTKSPKTLQRILDYNEDDCNAMAVLLDCLRPLSASA